MRRGNVYARMVEQQQVKGSDATEDQKPSKTSSRQRKMSTNSTKANAAGTAVTEDDEVKKKKALPGIVDAWAVPIV